MSFPSFDAGGVLRAANDRIVLVVAGHGGVVVQLSGTWVGTVTFQGSVDGSTFFSVNAVPVAGSTAVSTATSTGAWAIAAAGLSVVSVLCSAYTSGGIGVMLRSAPASPGGSSGGGGGGGGGAVTIADGADVAEGATTDAAITSSATGTVSAKLRGLIALQNPLDYDTGAGTDPQGLVGIALPASGGPVGVSVSNPLPSMSGLVLVAYDYISLAQAATTDTYTFKSGGSGGTSVATVTITYTDSTKVTISTVAKT